MKANRNTSPYGSEIDEQNNARELRIAHFLMLSHLAATE
jgi:hypothetical protein